MNAPENDRSADVSTKQTSSPTGFVPRALWNLSLIGAGSVLAIHAALAYSPDLARYVPDSLIKSPGSGATGSCHSAVPTGPTGAACMSRAVHSGDFGGCCSMRTVEAPVQTDGLYEEEPSDPYAEAPADAAECVPVEAAPSAEPEIDKSEGDVAAS